jgi:hypothetical protein
MEDGLPDWFSTNIRYMAKTPVGYLQCSGLGLPDNRRRLEAFLTNTIRPEACVNQEASRENLRLVRKAIVDNA